MTAKILLVNPPIYDFTAYDFWLKPYGLLSIGGFLRNEADLSFFDYLDRQHPFYAKQNDLRTDNWSRGEFYCEQIKPPDCIAHIPRYFKRFGLPRKIFQNFLAHQPYYDFVLIQTTMTYWYPGVAETIEDIRKLCPKTKIILGGNYVTICPEHAEKLGADFLIKETNLKSLWNYINIEPDLNQPALWELYDKLNVGVLKLADGCPFECTYCSVSKVYGPFKPRPLKRSIAELQLLNKLGVENIAFYDDALVYKPQTTIIPILQEKMEKNIIANLHTPNALNARFITQKLARIMVQAGFKTFYLGFESKSIKWQRQTGGKVYSAELAKAVKHLLTAGANPTDITAYQILGHPKGDIQQLEESMRFVTSLGIRGMLSDFSPIPGTIDGDYCEKLVNMSEPLLHNKTVFPVMLLGFAEVNRLKNLQRTLNNKLQG